MASVELFLLCIAAVFLIGVIGELVFARTGVPDVVWLIVVGIFMGPVFGFVDRSFLLDIAPFFGALTLVIVLFDGGVNDGRINLNRFVQVMATAPAKMFGLFPRKGTIAVGSDADLVLFDANETHTLSAASHHSNVDYSLFEGRKVTGKVKKVFLRGNLIVDGDEWLGHAGMGQYQKRSASGQVM